MYHIDSQQIACSRRGLKESESKSAKVKNSESDRGGASFALAWSALADYYKLKIAFSDDFNEFTMDLVSNLVLKKRSRMRVNNFVHLRIQSHANAPLTTR